MWFVADKSPIIYIDLYGEITIQFIFQRGAFTQQDTLSTFAYAKELAIKAIRNLSIVLIKGTTSLRL